MQLLLVSLSAQKKIKLKVIVFCVEISETIRPTAKGPLIGLLEEERQTRVPSYAETT